MDGYRLAAGIGFDKRRQSGTTRHGIPLPPAVTACRAPLLFSPRSTLLHTHAPVARIAFICGLSAILDGLSSSGDEGGEGKAWLLASGSNCSCYPRSLRLSSPGEHHWNGHGLQRCRTAISTGTINLYNGSPEISLGTIPPHNNVAAAMTDMQSRCREIKSRISSRGFVGVVDPAGAECHGAIPVISRRK